MLWLLWTCSGFASEPFEATPAALRAQALGVEADPDAAAVVVRERMEVEIAADGTMTRTWYDVVRVVSPEGVDAWSTMSIGWEPWFQDPPVLRARVVTADGREHVLRPDQVVDASDLSRDDVHSDARISEAPLPGIAPGAVVEMESVVRDHRPSFVGGRALQFVVGSLYPVDATDIVVRIDRTLPFHQLQTGGLDIDPKKRRVGAFDEYTYRVGPMDGWSEDLFRGSSEVRRLPAVWVSDAAGWDAVASAYAGLVDAALATPAEGFGADVVAADVDDAERVRRALEVIRDRVRYTGLQLGEAALAPQSPAETVARGYGDCKDQATLLVSLLRASGVDAEVALVNPGPGPDVVEETPGIEAFSHAIVHVPAHDWWIDPTAPFHAPDVVLRQLQGRRALPARPGAALVRIPPATPTSATYDEVRTYDLRALGPANVTERTRGTGWVDVALRAYAWGDPAAGRAAMERYAKAQYGVDTPQVRFGDAGDTRTTFETAIDVTGATDGHASEGFVYVSVRPDAALLWLDSDVFDGDDVRTVPAVLSPHHATVRYVLDTVPGYVWIDGPADEERAFGPVTVGRHTHRAEGRVEVELTLDTGDGHLSPDDVRALASWYRALPDTVDVTLGYGLDDIPITAALDRVDAIDATGSDRAAAYVLLSHALLQEGFGRAAVAYARRATELAPDDPWAWSTYGYVLLCDDVGRPIVDGVDPEPGRAALRRAIELSPWAVLAAQNLGVSLVHDEHATPFGPGARVDEAIAVLEERRRATGYVDLDGDLLRDLFVAERFAEVLARAPIYAESPARSATVVGATLLEQGPAAARKAVLDAASSKDDRLTVVRDASGLLIQVGRYAEVATLYDAVSRDVAITPTLRAELGVWGSAKRWVDPGPQTTPEGAYRRMTGLVLTAGSGEAIEAAMAEPLRTQLGDEGGWDAVDDAIRVATQEAGSQFGPSTLRDVVLGSIEVQSVGDRKVGFHVTGSIDGAPLAGMTFVEERGELRLRAMGNDRSAHGVEAARYEAAGKLEAARQWLAWASADRDQAHGPFSGKFPFDELYVPDADRDRVRLLAAMLAAERVPEHLATVEAGLSSLSGADLVAGRRALCGLLVHHQRNEAALGCLDTLDLLAPGDREAWVWRLGALERLGRLDEVLASIQAFLAKNPDDLAATKALVVTLRQLGRRQESEAAARDMLARGLAPGWAGNQVAWELLMRDLTDPEAAATALTAARKGGFEDAGTLHTLATAYAAQGHEREALELQAAAPDAGRSMWALVEGLRAESLGLTAVAREAYGRIAEDMDPDVVALARKRLAALPPPEADRFPLTGP